MKKSILTTVCFLAVLIILLQICTSIMQFSNNATTSNRLTAGVLDKSAETLVRNVNLLSNYSSLAAAVAAIGATETELIIDTDDTMTGVVGVPATLSLRFIQGNIITTGGNALTFTNSSVVAGIYQIFSGTGVAGLSECYADWWGTDQAAFTAASTASKVVYALGTYTFTSTATLSSNTAIDGKHQGQVNAGAIAKLRLFTGSGVSNITIKNLNFIATADPPTAIAVSILQSSNIQVLNNHCNDIQLYVNEEGAGYGATTLTDGILIDGNTMTNSLAALNTEDVKIFYGKNIVITNNYTSGWAQTLYVYGGNSDGHAPAQNSDRNAYNIVISDNVCLPASAGIGLSQVENAVVSNNTIVGGGDAAIWVGSSINVNVAGNTLNKVEEGLTVFGWTENVLFENNNVTVKPDGSRALYSYPLKPGNSGPLIYKGNSFDGLTETQDLIFHENAVIEFTDNYCNNVTSWFQGSHNVLKIENNTFSQDLVNRAGFWTFMIRIGALKDYTGKLTPTLSVKNNHFKYNAVLTKTVLQIDSPTNDAKAFFIGNEFYTTSASNDINIGGDYSLASFDVFVSDNYFTGNWDNNSGVTDATKLNVVWGDNYGPAGQNYFDYKTFGASHVFGSDSVFSLNGTLIWDPANLADGVGETSASITVTGATLGDYVVVAAPYDLQDTIATGYVQAADTVKIRLQNGSSGARDLGSGTWKVRVVK